MEISVIKAVFRELTGALPGARLAGLEEGGRGELCLTFKGPGGRLTLLLCPRPPMPRLYLAAGKHCRSKTLTPFAQSLRNRLIGSDVVGLTQDGLERAVTLHFARRSRAAGGTTSGEDTTSLVFEMGGKKPGLILVDGDGLISLAQSYVPISDDAVRPVLPGLRYAPPPKPDKVEPHELTTDDVARAVGERTGTAPEKALHAVAWGISPLMAGEALCGAGVPPQADRILSSLMGLLKRAEDGPYEPCIYETEKGPVLSAFPLKRFEGRPVKFFGSMSEAAKRFYEDAFSRAESAGKKAALLKEARARLKAAERRLAAIRSDASRADDADAYTRFGQLLMASPGIVPGGADKVELDDCFSETGGKVTIPLDPRQTQVENAERYFSVARKARSGARALEGRLADAEAQVGKLKGRLAEIERSESPDELAQSGKAGPVKGKGKKRQQPAALPSFVSSDGYEIIYSKSARTNDALTFRLAEPMDLWLHAQGYHGAHVIVRNPARRPDIPLDTILEAAAVAAYFSDARGDSSVPVDYTFRKYVRKPKDPSPGQAIFTNNKTVFVDPVKPGG